nr:4-aminobutyrate aminotransferase PuuE [Candidatus Pantoea persica]
MEGINARLQRREEEALPRGTGNLCSWYFEQAENATLRDGEGNSWIDFAGGIAVLNTGHRHPRVVQTIADKLEKFTHTAFQVAPYGSYMALAERLNARVQADRGPGQSLLFHYRRGSSEERVQGGARRDETPRHYHLRQRLPRPNLI